MTATLLRPAIPTDAEGIASVHVRAHEETYRPLRPAYAGPSYEDRLAMWRRVLAADAIVFVVEADREVVGFACGNGTQLTTLYLLRAWQRQGLGKRLLRAVLDGLAARGVAEVTFDVLADNLDAIRFYEAQGARCIGRATDVDAAGEHEDLVYAIRTGAADWT